VNKEITCSFVRSFLSVYNCSNKIYPLCLFPIDFYICTECAIRENKTAYLYMFGFYNVHILPSTLFILAKQCAWIIFWCCIWQRKKTIYMYIITFNLGPCFIFFSFFFFFFLLTKRIYLFNRVIHTHIRNISSSSFHIRPFICICLLYSYPLHRFVYCIYSLFFYI